MTSTATRRDRRSSTPRVRVPGGSARQIRWAAALGAIVVGSINLVVTAAHGVPMPGAKDVALRIVRAVLGAQYLLPAAGMTLIWVSRGLLHAKRNARLAAVVASAASVIGTYARGQHVLGVVPSAALLVILLIGRDAFRAPHDPARLRDALRLLVVGELIVFVYGTLGLYLLDSQFVGTTTVLEAVGDALRSMVLLPESRIDPASVHGRWLLESVRVGALIAVLVAATRLIAPFVVRRSTPAEERAVAAILQQWGDTSMASFHLLGDKSWFLSRAEDAFIGYTVVGRTAVALGDPVGSPAARVAAARQFCGFCDLNGWVPAFHQVTPDGASVLAEAGLKATKIGEEAIVPVQTWSLDGPEHKSLRSALRRVERAGYEVVELTQPLDEPTFTELRRVSDRWMADGSRRERTFTVGQFDADYLRSTTVLAVRHRDTGKIAAFANIVDSYHAPDGNFDLMRRDPDAPNGVMEYLFVALIARFKADGRHGMTLGLAPMANIVGRTTRDRAMRLAYERGERVFNYQGLRRFKEKWSPRWEPRYLGYRTDADLAKVALAVMRAGELPDRRSLAGRLRNLGRRQPATITLGSLVIWFMAVTDRSETVHRELLRHLGLAWRDLVHLQLWRLPTSMLVETRAGFVWSNVALFFLVLPIAEWRLGTRRTVAVFFLCDWFSTIITFLGLRLAATWSPEAARLLEIRDGGPSAGAWALAITIALTSVQRVRRPLAAALFAFLLFAVVLHHRLYDTQHLLAAAAATVAVFVMRAKRPRQMTTTGVPI